MEIICWLKTIYRSFGRGINLFIDGIFISGHDYVEQEIHHNCEVTISKCKICGKVDISWRKEDELP